MTPSTPELHAIVDRLEKVERQNRALKRVGAAVLSALGAILLMAQAAPNSQTVEARKFVLKDSGGKVRADLSMQALGPAFRLLDEDGNDRADISILDANPPIGGVPHLGLYDDKGSLEVSMSVGPQAIGPIAYLSDARGESTVELSVSPDTGPALVIGPTADLSQMSKGAVKPDPIRLSVLPGEGPSLELTDQQGYSSVIGNTGLVTPSTGETRLRSAASVVLFDNNKHVIWQTPLR